MILNHPFVDTVKEREGRCSTTGPVIPLPYLYLIISWIMVGVIWVIQLVHYPAFAFVEEDTFIVFHRHHSFSVSLIVMPLMLTELALSLYLAYRTPPSFLFPLVIVLLLWASTFLIQVPLHQALGTVKDSERIELLVRTNWVRTALWTLKAIWVSFAVRS